jgi:hypothetical protein
MLSEMQTNGVLTGPSDAQKLSLGGRAESPPSVSGKSPSLQRLRTGGSMESNTEALELEVQEIERDRRPGCGNSSSTNPRCTCPIL